MQLHLDPDQILDMVTSSLDSDKAEDVLSIPLGGKSSVADYMVIASGTSSRQVAAMAEHLEFRLKQAGVEVLGLEGMRQADWVLIDANDVIIHLFRPEVREFYGLSGCGRMTDRRRSSPSAARAAVTGDLILRARMTP